MANLFIWMEKNTFARSVAANQTLGDHLWNSNQIEITTLLTLPQFTIILHSNGRNDGKKNGSLTEIAKPVSSWSVMLAQLPAIPLQMQPRFIHTILLGREDTSSILLVLPTIVIITPRVREPRWRFYTLLRLYIPIILSGIGVLSTAWAWDPTGPTMRWTRVRSPLLSPPNHPHSGR